MVRKDGKGTQVWQNSKSDLRWRRSLSSCIWSHSGLDMKKATEEGKRENGPDFAVGITSAIQVSDLHTRCRFDCNEYARETFLHESY